MEGRREREQKSKEKMKRLFDKKDANQTIQDFYYDRIIEGMSFKSIEDYTKYVIRFTEWMNHEGKEEYNTIKKADISRFLDSLNYDKRGIPKKVSDSYHAVVFTALKNFFNYLADEDVKIIERNPMENMRRPKVRDETKQVYLTKSEIHKMFNNISEMTKNPDTRVRDELILRIFLISGARVSAVDDLNITNDINEEIVFLDKGGKRSRYQLDQITKGTMKKWLQIRKEWLDKEGKNTEALIINRKGERLSTKGISRLVSKYTATINKHVTPHKLRATYASQIYLKTKDPLYTQQMMHHANLTTTQRYLSGIQRDEQKAMNIMTELLN